MRFESTRPIDLAGAATLGTLAALAALVEVWLPVRVVLTFPLVAFLPGYVLLSMLFPERYREADVPRGAIPREKEHVRHGLTAFERTALSIGLSLVLVPAIGLVLNSTRWGIAHAPVVLAITLFVITGCAIGTCRRLRLPPEDRIRFTIRVEPRAWQRYDTVNRVLTVGLLVALAVTGGGLAHLHANPDPGESHTEAYILSAEGTASGYPTNLTVGEEGRVRVHVVSHEHATAHYRIRATAEDAATENRAPVALEEWEVTLEPGEAWDEEVSFRFEETGTYRVVFRVDRDGAEEQPYRRLHLQVRVTN